MDYITYRKLWDNAHEVTPDIPLNLDIEISSTCNLKCPFCAYTSKTKKKTNSKFITLHDINHILITASILGIPAIKLNWIGEPTLHPKFEQIMEFISFHNYRDVIINTNGNYKRKSISKSLILTTKIIFSVDSMNEKIYSRIRIGGNHKLLLSNIQDVLKEGHENVILRRVISTYNENENDFKIKVIKEFGNSVIISEHYAFDRNPLNSSMLSNTTDLCRKYCGYPSQRLSINSDGDIFPCCVDYNFTMKLGNVYKNSIMKIWESSRLKSIREKLKNYTFPSRTCRYCNSWISYKHPFAEKVKQ